MCLQSDWERSFLLSFFSFKDIKDRFTSTSTAIEINKVLDEKLEDFLDVKLKGALPMLAMFLNKETRAKIKDTLHLEFQNIFAGHS
jgi:hypothetical protein